ncbi:hypothetical protein EG68_05139 [Paragonimus skrjabini miyazakii]|uniref:Protein kinase domain-containing protein n=1 Tax=Paragonimus skrjabini miyazakii TaxID=59628 RepID=A0A8S9YVN3_9TREM|nr:hypothetical protein EG68_05139 [Paragonimus skrjabini miyazakii]
MTNLSSDKSALIESLPIIDEKECGRLIERGVLCGSGCFGVVYQSYWNCQKVAIKLSTHPEMNAKHLLQELLIHVQYSAHPNIVRVLAAGPNVSTDCRFFLMEYADCFSLNEVLHRLPEVSYTLAHAISWTLQVSQAVDYLHRGRSLPLCHGDLKPANMLLFDNGRFVKLTDFGAAGPLIVEHARRPATLVYTAPEIACVKSGSQLRYTEKCDVYSLAISLWEFLARQRPYETPGSGSSAATFWSIFHKRPPKLRNCPPLLQNLMESGWAEEPGSRPSMLQISDLLEFVLQHMLLRGSQLTPLSVPTELPNPAGECRGDGDLEDWLPEQQDI